jgi:hypothetical protein
MTAKLKAVYSVAELAALAGVSKKVVRRLAYGQLGLPKPGERKKMLVPVDCLREAFPGLWESILTRQALLG